ncbi:hypothetical protein Daesc_005457 [Daldinia eschscholtzii]|uniref:Caspase domain-containing protein n=1 Tax=Daldinia eschscholtzii TaxID=292717 RepID=A0AAX6ML76_9PEZI
MESVIKQPTIIEGSNAVSLALSVPQTGNQEETSVLGLDTSQLERRYCSIKAVVLHWYGEDLDKGYYGPAHEATKLAKTLADWGWQTEDHFIMPDDPVKKTAKFLRGLTRESKSDELLVVYYVGHGRRSSRKPTPQPFSVARRGSSCGNDASIDWPIIRSVLEGAKCDVVMFLNCCYGADAWVSRNLQRDGFKGPPGKVMCILAATSENEIASIHEPISFGTLLKRVLDSARMRLGLDMSISIPMLTQAMRDEIKQSTHFQVKDIVHGRFQPMNPRLQYSQVDGESRDIWLHRTLGDQSISEIIPLEVLICTWYQPLSGPAGEYWQRELQATIL